MDINFELKKDGYFLEGKKYSGEYSFMIDSQKVGSIGYSKKIPSYRHLDINGIYIYGAYIVENLQGKGYGEMMVRNFLNWLEEKFPAIKTYVLEVWEVNVLAVKCYEKAGFKAIKKVHDRCGENYYQMIYER